MKTSFRLDHSLAVRLKREAARRGCTMSELVETALRALFLESKARRPLPPLPTFNSQGHLVDVADRDVLYQAMEGR